MAFQKEPRGADFPVGSPGAFRSRTGIERRIGKDRDIGGASDVSAPGFFLLHLRVGRSDQLIGALVKIAGGMKLVADAAFRPLSQHCGALVTERIRMLESAEFTPRGMEFSSHAEEIEIKFPAIGGRHRIMVIAPAAGRQGFQLQMAEIRQDVTISGGHIAAVVENRHIRVERTRGGSRALIIFQQSPSGKLFAVFRIEGIVSLFRHILHAPLAAAGRLADDINENAVRIGEEMHRLLNHAAEIVQIGSIEAEFLESRFKRAADPACQLAFGCNLPPFRVFFRGKVVHSARQIDRDIDVDLMAGIHLRAEQIEIESGMHFPDLCRMITPAMMA